MAPACAESQVWDRLIAERNTWSATEIFVLIYVVETRFRLGVQIHIVELLVTPGDRKIERPDERNVHRGGDERNAQLEKDRVGFLLGLRIRRSAKSERIVRGFHRVGYRVLVDLAMFVTNGEVPASIPEVREKMSVHLGIIEEVTLIEFRMAEERGVLRAEVVIVGRGPDRNAIPEVWRRWVVVIVYRRDAHCGCGLTDEWIEQTSRSGG